MELPRAALYVGPLGRSFERRLAAVHASVRTTPESSGGEVVRTGSGNGSPSNSRARGVCGRTWDAPGRSDSGLFDGAGDSRKTRCTKRVITLPMTAPPMSMTMSNTELAPSPQAHTLRKRWCRGPESNWRHMDFQSIALPTELPR